MQAAQQRIVEVGGPDLDAIRAVIAGVEGVEALGAGEKGRLRVSHGEVPPAELNRRLVEAGVAVDALVPAGRNLEDVFMEVTT